MNAAGGLVVRDRGGPWPVALVIYEDASRSAQATAATEKLLGDERVDLLIGPYSSMLPLAVAPVIQHFSPGNVQHMIECVVAAARAISEQLGWNPKSGARAAR